MTFSGITAHHIYKKFNDQDVLRDLSLHVRACESMVILGLSGAGKSVFFRCLLGLEMPDLGYVCIGENNLNQEKSSQQEKRFQNSGIVFQSPALFDSLPLWENITFSMKGTPTEKRNRAIELLKIVGLSASAIDLYTSELSGGMKRRVSIARAIVNHPKYLFFDEPTEGLDPISVQNTSLLIRNVILNLKATSITITHNLKSAHMIADQIAFLCDGGIAWQGTFQEMLVCPLPAIKEFVTSALITL